MPASVSANSTTAMPASASHSSASVGDGNNSGHSAPALAEEPAHAELGTELTGDIATTTPRRETVPTPADRSDPWHQLIEDWVQSRDTVTVTEVLTSCIGKPLAQWTQSDKNRIARSLQALGWERFQHRDGSVREWRYRSH